MKKSKIRNKFQIQNPKSEQGNIYKIFYIVGILTLGFLILSLGFIVSGCAEKNGQEKLEVITVNKGEILSSIPATGTVMPRNRLEVKPPIAGRIDTVLIEEGQSVKRGKILAWMSSTDRAVLLDAARAKGDAELKRWEEVYKPTPIIAPIDGFIIQRNVEPGQSFSVSEVVLVMADYLIVKAQVDETDIGKIKLGQKVEVVLDAYPDQKNWGKVEQIAYESKTVNNVTVYEIDVVLTKVSPLVRAGMSATVNFLQGDKKQVLLVPSKAVRKSRSKAVVFKVLPDGKTERTEIETGMEDDQNIEVVSGLSLGDKIAIPNKTILDKLRQSEMRGPMNPFTNNQKKTN
ncbi:MAG: efflux RND transporter periplasmic adaptor subunit [Candidatus Saganbacteria bacterium]|nr:efflux RND transporter periplasmic adaptor subunit [Candidatus Saganbacteria bacterium]